MSNREVILQALERVRRRLELGRTLHDAALVLGMLAAGLLLWRVPLVFSGSAPAYAAAILAALLLWGGGLFLLACRRLAPRRTLGEAAASADARAGLKDELATARWFLQYPVTSPWVEAQAARAAESARRLDPVALLPLRLGWPGLSGGAAAVLILVAACLAQPVLSPSDAAGDPQPLAQAQARQVQLIRALISEQHGEATARTLESALTMLERKTATPEQKRRALLDAEGAIGQQGLEAAALRDRLYRLAASLRGNQRTEEVVRALERGNAQLAAKLLQQLSGQPGATGSDRQSAAATQSDVEQELARLLATVADDEDQAQGAGSGAAARQAADRLTRIGERLAAQDQWSQAVSALAQLQQAVAQEPSSAIAGSRQQAAGRGSENAKAGAAGPNVQQAGINGPDTGPSGREGGKPGAAAGDAQSDPVLGRKIVPLAVRLRQESIDAANAAAQEWFYTETKKRASRLDLEPARARSEFTLGQSAALEGVALRNRQIVKEYFMALHQGARP